MRGGGLGSYRRVRRRYVGAWVFSIFRKRSACRDCCWQHGWWRSCSPMPTGPGKAIRLVIWPCCGRKWDRSLRRWTASLISRGCGSSIRRLGNSWYLLARGNWWMLPALGPSQPDPVPVLPAFSCDLCDAVYGKLRALRSHQKRAHQRRREARSYVLDSICPVWKTDFPVEAEGYSASAGGSMLPVCRWGQTGEFSDAFLVVRCMELLLHFFCHRPCA